MGQRNVSDASALSIVSCIAVASYEVYSQAILCMEINVKNSLLPKFSSSGLHSVTILLRAFYAIVSQL